MNGELVAHVQDEEILEKYLIATPSCLSLPQDKAKTSRLMPSTARLKPTPQLLSFPFLTWSFSIYCDDAESSSFDDSSTSFVGHSSLFEYDVKGRK